MHDPWKWWAPWKDQKIQRTTHMSLSKCVSLCKWFHSDTMSRQPTYMVQSRNFLLSVLTSRRLSEVGLCQRPSLPLSCSSGFKEQFRLSPQAGPKGGPPWNKLRLKYYLPCLIGIHIYIQPSILRQSVNQSVSQSVSQSTRKEERK